MEDCGAGHMIYVGNTFIKTQILQTLELGRIPSSAAAKAALYEARANLKDW